MTIPVAPQSDAKLIATWKKVAALPVAVFFGAGCVFSAFAGLFSGVLLFLALTLIPVLYLLTVRRNALKRRQAAATGDTVSPGPNWLWLGIPAVVALFVGFGFLSDAELRPDPNALVPNVVGASLSDARAALRDAGLEVATEDDTGQDRSVWNASNWTATRQSPEAGARIGDTRAVTVGVIKDGEKTAAQQAAEKMSTAPTPATTTASISSSAAPSTAPSTASAAPSTTATADVPAPPESKTEVPPPLTDEEQRMIEDAAHITNLKMGGIDFGSDEAAAIASGRLTCKYIDSASSPSLAILESVQAAQEAGFSRREAEFMVGSAVGSYCDKYAPLLTR
ncbi:DUF732 domain-containing protein [Rhodococcus hoagii]|nr:DUF732 domain-containing protein [Prescottella equi]NKR80621.1 DUF732 domain-containing protein [Prescottella equi]NKS99446.1 DUF732 domain-containing protein [Prescottella equi]